MVDGRKPARQWPKPASAACPLTSSLGPATDSRMNTISSGLMAGFSTLLTTALVCHAGADFRSHPRNPRWDRYVGWSSSASVFSAADYQLHSFKKIQLSDQFWSEGANFGDFNHDGKKDVVSGDRKSVV